MSDRFDTSDTSDDSTLATGSPARVVTPGDLAIRDMWITLALRAWESVES